MGFTKEVPWTDFPFRKITLKPLVVREFSKANTVKYNCLDSSCEK